MPGFHHSVAVLQLPFCRCKIPVFCKNYARKFRSVPLQPFMLRNGSSNGNGAQKRQRLTGTAKRQRKNGNGMMVETGHHSVSQIVPF